MYSLEYNNDSQIGRNSNCSYSENQLVNWFLSAVKFREKFRAGQISL